MTKCPEIDPEIDSTLRTECCEYGEIPYRLRVDILSYLEFSLDVFNAALQEDRGTGAVWVFYGYFERDITRQVFRLYRHLHFDLHLEGHNYSHIPFCDLDTLKIFSTVPIRNEKIFSNFRTLRELILDIVPEDYELAIQSLQHASRLNYVGMPLRTGTFMIRRFWKIPALQLSIYFFSNNTFIHIAIHESKLGVTRTFLKSEEMVAIPHPELVQPKSPMHDFDHLLPIPMGNRAVGNRAVDNRAVGNRAVDNRAVGNRAVDKAHIEGHTFHDSSKFRRFLRQTDWRSVVFAWCVFDGPAMVSILTRCISRKVSLFHCLVLDWDSSWCLPENTATVDRLVIRSHKGPEKIPWVDMTPCEMSLKPYLVEQDSLITETQQRLRRYVLSRKTPQ